MKKTFCDVCGRGVMGKGGIDIPVHICQKMGVNTKHSDLEGNSVSGRSEYFDLCNRCTNAVFGAVWEAIQKIKGES